MEESLGLSIEQFGVLDARFFPYFIRFFVLSYPIRCIYKRLLCFKFYREVLLNFKNLLYSQQLLNQAVSLVASDLCLLLIF